MLEVFTAYLITGAYLTFCGFWKDKQDGYANEWKEWHSLYAVPLVVVLWPYVAWAMANDKDLFWNEG